MDARSPVCSRQQIVQFAREHLRTGDRTQTKFVVISVCKNAPSSHNSTPISTILHFQCPKKLRSAASADKKIEDARSNV